MLLILDLDETLMHATEVPLARDPDFIVDGRFFVYKRPHVDRFIAFCHEHFELAVWTSASQSYAEQVVRQLFPPEVTLTFLWASKRCVQRIDLASYEMCWIKDLVKVKRRGYALEQVLVVDDSPEKLSRHYGNLIRVTPFEGDMTDRELEMLPRFLLRMKGETNVRTIEKRGWRHAVQTGPR